MSNHSTESALWATIGFELKRSNLETVSEETSDQRSLDPGFASTVPFSAASKILLTEGVLRPAIAPKVVRLPARRSQSACQWTDRSGVDSLPTQSQGTAVAS
jgi:hypothetical protein